MWQLIVVYSFSLIDKDDKFYNINPYTILVTIAKLFLIEHIHYRAGLKIQFFVF